MSTAGARASRPARRRASGAALTALLLLAACGDDDQRPRATAPAAPTATAALAATASPSPTRAGQATPVAGSPSPTRPTATVTATRPTRTVTPRLTATVRATPGPNTAALVVGLTIGPPGESAEFGVTLAAGRNVAGTLNDISFPPEAPVAVRANDRPDCTVNPLINKSATSFAFQPPGCEPGVDCSGVRAIVLAFDNLFPIVPGALLYWCRVAIPLESPTGPYPLRCSNAAAGDRHGNTLPTTCADGVVVVDFFPIPSPTPTPTPMPTPTATAPARPEPRAER